MAFWQDGYRASIKSKLSRGAKKVSVTRPAHLRGSFSYAATGGVRVIDGSSTNKHWKCKILFVSAWLYFCFEDVVIIVSHRHKIQVIFWRSVLWRTAISSRFIKLQIQGRMRFHFGCPLWELNNKCQNWTRS